MCRGSPLAEIRPNGEPRMGRFGLEGRTRASRRLDPEISRCLEPEACGYLGLSLRAPQHGGKRTWNFATSRLGKRRDAGRNLFRARKRSDRRRLDPSLPVIQTVAPRKPCLPTDATRHSEQNLRVRMTASSRELRDESL